MSSYRLNNTLKTKIKKTLLLSLITLPITASAHTYTDHHSHPDKKHHSLKEHTTTSYHTHHAAQQHTLHSKHNHKSETEHKSAIHHKATHELKVHRSTIQNIVHIMLLYMSITKRKGMKYSITCIQKNAQVFINITI